MKRLIPVFLLLFLSFPVYADDYQDGVDAGRRGDYKTAIEKFESLAEEGHAQAQFTLGLMYGVGHGVPQNFKKSEKWYRKAANKGHAEAQHAIGLLYYDGQRLPQDYKKAVHWFRMSAKNGFAEAQARLGIMYFAGGQGLLQDFKEAEKWSRKAAKQGDADAQTILGIMYSEGQGVPQDDKESVKWLLLAANQGISQAQAMLGIMYSSGLGVQKNLTEAIKWYRLAAEQGVPEAQLALDKIMSGMAEAAQKVDEKFLAEKNGDKKASADLLTDEKPKFDGKSSIFLKCKTKQRKFMETDILEFNPSIGKLIWVEDDKGLSIYLPMEIEEYSGKFIKASYTIKKMLAALESVQQDLDQKGLAELQQIKSSIDYIRNVLPDKLVKEGVSSDETQKMTQKLLDMSLGFKQYVELDRYSGEIRWIQPYRKPQISAGKDIKRELRKVSVRNWKGNFSMVGKV
ncbi:MAG: tetratricopeptide repeat protein [Nitrospinae bacterium]|nr:tetratricopeptide repeat protein [Nitrospinota bacterium]